MILDICLGTVIVIGLTCTPSFIHHDHQNCNLKADQETFHRSCIIRQMPLKAISCQFPRKVSEAFARHEEVFIQQPHPEEFPQTYNKKCWSLFGVLGHRTTEWKKSPEKLSEHKSQWYILTSTKLRGNSFLDGAGPCISFTLNSHSLYVLPWLFNHKSGAP